MEPEQRERHIKWQNHPINLAFDKDMIGYSDRAYTTEQVGYIVFDLTNE